VSRSVQVQTDVGVEDRAGLRFVVESPYDEGRGRWKWVVGMGCEWRKKDLVGC
jgi:hypothetical protein